MSPEPVRLGLVGSKELRKPEAPPRRKPVKRKKKYTKNKNNTVFKGNFNCLQKQEIRVQLNEKANEGQSFRKPGSMNG